MKELFKDIFEALVTIGLVVAIGFWFGVGLLLGMKVVSLY